MLHQTKIRQGEGIKVVTWAEIPWMQVADPLRILALTMYWPDFTDVRFLLSQMPMNEVSNISCRVNTLLVGHSPYQHFLIFGQVNDNTHCTSAFTFGYTSKSFH
ncbi:MAG: hypothetical protein R3E79_60785 [Caldilineaceae bacterium]